MWLVDDSISRRVSGLSISELELATIVIVIAAIMNYLFWWDKPQGAKRVFLEAPDTISSELIQRLLHDEIIQEELNHCEYGRVKNTVALMKILRDLGNADVDATNLSHMLALTAIVSVVFCGLHLVARNFPFASEVEKWLWRACSISCLVSSLGVVFCLWLILHETEKCVITTTKLFLTLFAVFYVLARACIVVEVLLLFVPCRSQIM